MFKKILTIGLAAVVALSCASCASCGKKNNDENLKTTEELYTYTTGINLNGKKYNVVENGEAKYNILLPASASAIVLSAATEFNDYIEDVSGTRLLVINENAEGVKTESKFISIGDTQAKADANIDTKDIEDDGFVIKTVDGNVYLAANIDRGVTYAVYSFLERFLGVRWLTARETYIPASSTITVQECDIVEEPLFGMRLWMNGDYTNTSMKNHFRFYDGKDLWLSGVSYVKSDGTTVNLTDTHNTTDSASQPGIGWINKVDPDPTNEGKTLAETHPEYFSDHSPNKASSYEICYTNGIDENGNIAEGQSVASLMVDKMKRLLEADADNQQYKYVMVGHIDDSSAYCECDTCTERKEKYTSPGIQLIFLNAVEKAVNEWLIETQGRTVNLVMFAYQYAYNPPVTKEDYGSYTPLVTANENISIRIAPIDADYTYGFNDSRQISSQYDSLHGWAAVARHFMIWDYVCNYVEYFWYFPNLNYLKENTKLYSEMGVEYCMFQSSYTQSKIWHDDMRCYIASKLMWNLGWNVEELMNEYIDLYYGAAAQTVKDVISSYENFYTMQRNKGELKVALFEPTGSFLSSDANPVNWLEGIVRIIDNGMLEIENDSKLTENEKNGLIYKLEEVKITPMRMILRNYDSYYTEGKKDYAIEFFNIVDAHGIKGLGETEIRSVATRKKECGLSV